MKYNKVWVMYERNEVQALSGKGSVLGVDMVTRGEPAIYPFTIFNDAAEARSYRVTVMAGGNLALDSGSDTLRIYVDANANGTRDAGENTELLPAGTVTLRAKTDLDLLAVHRPNWDSVYDTNERYGRAGTRTLKSRDSCNWLTQVPATTNNSGYKLARHATRA